MNLQISDVDAESLLEQMGIVIPHHVKDSVGYDQYSHFITRPKPTGDRMIIALTLWNIELTHGLSNRFPIKLLAEMWRLLVQ